jgi:hypothetical protein
VWVGLFTRCRISYGLLRHIHGHDGQFGYQQKLLDTIVYINKHDIELLHQYIIFCLGHQLNSRAAHHLESDR